MVYINKISLRLLGKHFVSYKRALFNVVEETVLNFPHPLSKSARIPNPYTQSLEKDIAWLRKRNSCYRQWYILVLA